MSGAAVMNVAYRYNQTGTNYDVHKYTSTADVAASFTWGTSGYSGSLDFTNFDDKNAIVANAGFTSFTVAITGTDHTYTGNSTTSLQNDWLGGASVAGALYGIPHRLKVAVESTSTYINQVIQQRLEPMIFIWLKVFI